jgi:hypothetical protein
MAPCKAAADAKDEMVGLVPVTRSAELVGVEKRLHEVRAHLKYVWTDQRTVVYDEKRPRAQQDNALTGHQICRMSVLDMVHTSHLGRVVDF